MRRGPDRSQRRARRRGLSPLPLPPFVVGRSGQRLHVVDAAECAGHAGDSDLATFKKTPPSERQYRRKCGGHLMTRHPTLGLVDVFAATIPTLSFEPGVHMNYAETVMPMRDGLPKLKDFPAEFGGSGEAVPE